MLAKKLYFVSELFLADTLQSDKCLTFGVIQNFTYNAVNAYTCSNFIFHFLSSAYT